MSFQIQKVIILFASLSFTASLFTQDGASPASQDTPESSIDIGGLIRVRAEVRSNTGYSSNANTSEYVAQKSQLWIEKKLANDALVKITLQDARIWGGEPNSMNGLSTANEGDAGASDITETVDLREAYFETGDLLGETTLRIGRQKLAFGGQRLFGALDWTNIGRSFDAVHLIRNTPGTNISLWSAFLQEGDSADTKESSVSQGLGDYLYNGFYYSQKGLSFANMDFYYSNKLNTDDSYSLKRHTAGGRIYRTTPESGGLDYSIEGAYQFGLVNDATIAAFAAAATFGYTLSSPKIRIGLEADIASGDNDPLDSKNETFDNLFHTNHIYYGQADQVSWQNMTAYSANVKVFRGKFTLALAYWYVSKYTENDNWYSVVGGAASNEALIAGSKEKHLFNEADVTLKYKASDSMIVEGGYSHVLRGSALNDVQADADYGYGYLSALMKF